MKLVIASDIHGSASATQTLVEHIEFMQPDRILLLGDLLYHGPRNPLPEGHGPKKVVELLNNYADRIVSVRGNCEAEVDQMMLEFPCMGDYTQIIDGNHTLFATHGHLFTPEDHPPLPANSAFLSGHTHVKVLEKRGDIVYVNPGSTSLPKDGSASFATYEDGVFSLRTLDGSVISQLSI